MNKSKYFSGKILLLTLFYVALICVGLIYLSDGNNVPPSYVLTVVVFVLISSLTIGSRTYDIAYKKGYDQNDRDRLLETYKELPVRIGGNFEEVKIIDIFRAPQGAWAHVISYRDSLSGLPGKAIKHLNKKIKIKDYKDKVFKIREGELISLTEKVYK